MSSIKNLLMYVMEVDSQTTKEKLTEEEMSMARYDHARSDELDSTVEVESEAYETR